MIISDKNIAQNTATALQRRYATVVVHTPTQNVLDGCL